MPLGTSNPGLSSDVAQEVFPATARGMALELGLVDGEITILRHAEADDGGGAPRTTYTPDSEPVRGRIDPIGRSYDKVSGEQIDESSTHVLTIDPDDTLTSKDRIKALDSTWAITAVLKRSNKAVTRAEIKEVASV